MKPAVGLIGLGLMGKPMGRNWLKAGFPLQFGIGLQSRAEDLLREGAKWGASPREVAAASDVLLTIVSDPPALEQVLWGANGAIEGLKRGSVLVDSSTVSPGLARRAAAACEERGIDFLDAPVTGGTWGAEAGELVFMIGGKQETLSALSRCCRRWGSDSFCSGRMGPGKP